MEGENIHVQVKLLVRHLCTTFSLPGSFPFLIILGFCIEMFLSAKRSWCTSSTCRILNRKSRRWVCSFSSTCVNYTYFYTLAVLTWWYAGGKRTPVMRASKARWMKMRRKRFPLTWRCSTWNLKFVEYCSLQNCYTTNKMLYYKRLVICTHIQGCGGSLKESKARWWSWHRASPGETEYCC